MDGDEESLTEALRREVKEETGLDIEPTKLLFVEDFLSSRAKHIKIWFLCKVTGGRLEKTPGAVEEGILETGWFSRKELGDETVYPSVLPKESWDSFFSDNFEARYLGSSIADF